MAHFAELNSDNVVIRVIVVDNKDTTDAYGVEKESIGIAYCEKHWGGNWKQTSYNGNLRKNYAGIGFTYNSSIDAFVPPKPYDSWTLNEETGLWDPPIPLPVDHGNPELNIPPSRFVWNEESGSWDKIQYS